MSYLPTQVQTAMTKQAVWLAGLHYMSISYTHKIMVSVTVNNSGQKSKYEYQNYTRLQLTY